MKTPGENRAGSEVEDLARHGGEKQHTLFSTQKLILGQGGEAGGVFSIHTASPAPSFGDVAWLYVFGGHGQRQPHRTSLPRPSVAVFHTTYFRLIPSSISGKFVRRPSSTGLEGDSGNHWAIKGGDAQSGPLKTLYDGVRPKGYEVMKKQGAIILGIGGDNSDAAIGSFFEGVMTAGFTTDQADDAVHANVVAAGYGR